MPPRLAALVEGAAARPVALDRGAQPRRLPAFPPNLHALMRSPLEAARGDGTPPLPIRPPFDPLEREADDVATQAATAPGDLATQAAAAPGVAAQAAPRAEAPPRPSALLPASRGEPLDPELRARVEPLVGASLDQVRVHSGPDAQALARGLSARAFTHDHHIYLGARQDLRDPAVLAHEAAHVVHQQGPARGSLQRLFFWAHTQHPNQPAYPTPPHLHPSAARCDPRALAAIDHEVVELRGTSTFDPSPALAEALWCLGTDCLVRARFGDLASGVLRVRAIPLPTMMGPGGGTPSLQYQTATDDEFLELHHPSFPGGGLDYPPRLLVSIRDRVVTGRISFVPGGSRLLARGLDAWTAGYALERLLGWEGLRNVTPSGTVNELRDGVLRFTMTELSFQLDDTTTLGGLRFDGSDAIHGTGSFRVVDDAETFAANADVEAEGISAGAMPLRKHAGRISGAASFTLSLAPTDAFGGTFSGSIDGNFAGGILTLQGTARYRSRRASGSLTLLLAPRLLAWTRVAQRLPVGTANAPSITYGAAGRSGYALVGWGSIEFALNEWLTGNVSAVLDPDGYITSHGVLRPTREFQFLTDRERTSAARPIGRRLEGSITILPVADVFDLGGHASAELFAEARVGPGRIYDLEVQGSFSTRPGSVLEASATGRINLSAWARLRAEVGGGLHFSVAGDVVRLGSVDIEGSATATVRAYAELQPTFERIADPDHPGDATFRISGALTAAGAAELGFDRGRIVIRVAGVRVWTVRLGSYQWPLGSLGMRATISHVIGSHAPIDVDFESADFDDARFSAVIEDLTNRRGARNDRSHDSELAQDPTTRPADRPDVPTVLERPFSMNGAPHRLWVEHDPEAVIMMASGDGDRLEDKLRAERAVVEEQQQQGGPAAEELAEEAAEAGRILGQTQAVEHSLAALQSEAREAGDVAGFQELADSLTTYGAQFEKSDLAEPTPEPASPVVIEDGRYVITNQAELDAVRAIQPQLEEPPDQLDPDLEGYWQDYTTRYFPDRLREIERVIERSRTGTSSRNGPQVWDAYVAARRTFDPLRAAKDFQPELRELILQEHPGLEASRVEIDVGVRATRRGVRGTTRFADVVITDVANDNIEVYSAKVHDVRSAAVGRNDLEVTRWIRSAMAEDVDEAAQSYGYEVEFRRPRQATSEGRLGGSGSPAHPLFASRVYVSNVHLVWQYTSNLIPGRFIDDIVDAGDHYGVQERRRRKVQVDFQLRPEPPANPPP